MSRDVVVRYLPRAATALLAVAVTYQLATIVSTLSRNVLVARSPFDGSAGRPAQPVQQGSNDLAGLVDAHLFGEAPHERLLSVAVKDAPATSLSVKLLGVLLGATEADSQAIISNVGGNEKTYRVGEPIENGDAATVYAIGLDRVLLQRGARVEAVYLSKTPNPTGASIVKLSEQASSTLESVASTTQAPPPEEARLTQALGLVPPAQDGGVVGFRVAAGFNDAAVVRLGLRPGDVVTDVQGSTDSGGEDRSAGYGPTELLNVTVVSDGIPRTVVIAGSQLNQLRAKLQ